jgi:hypothetical protein
MEGTHEVGRKPFMPDSTLNRHSVALDMAYHLIKLPKENSAESIQTLRQGCHPLFVAFYIRLPKPSLGAYQVNQSIPREALN